MSCKTYGGEKCAMCALRNVAAREKAVTVKKQRGHIEIDDDWTIWDMVFIAIILAFIFGLPMFITWVRPWAETWLKACC